MKEDKPKEDPGPYQNWSGQLPTGLVRKARVRAILEGKTTKDIVEEALRAYLK